MPCNKKPSRFTSIWLVSGFVAIAGIVAFGQSQKGGAARHPNRSARFHSLHPKAAQPKLTSKAMSPSSDPLQLPDGLTEQVPVLKGYQLAPVELNMEGKDPELVGLGSYLVNSSSCGDCHTNPLFMPGGDPFKGQTPIINTAGYMGGGRVFGTVVSRNLTPEPENGNLPAGMDFDEFLHVMRTGEDTDKLHPDVSPLLQTMPWPELGRLTDHDLRAIYEYLSALPPVSIPGVK